MNVYLIRHGKTEWNRDKKFQGQKNSPLLDEGKEQARLLGRRLGGTDFAGLYCSPLSRTRETAELLGLPGEFTPEDAFMEISLGNLEGRSFGELEDEVKPLVEKFWDAPGDFDKSLTGGEDFHDIRIRSVEKLEQLVTEHDDADNIVIVSHGALLKSLVNHYLDKPLEEFWAPPMLEPASLTILKFSEGRFLGVETLGDISHYSVLSACINV